MILRKKTEINRWMIFSVTGAGIFLATSAVTVVNVALPFITDAFQSNISITQWVLLVYLITTSSLLINFGRLGDLLSPFRVHYLGLLIFTLASFLCSLAQSVEMLIAFRIIQGLGGAMIISNSPGTVTSVFPPDQRGKVLGFQVAVVGVALTIGPPLAGLLIGLFGWRSIFLYNVPFGIMGIIFCWLIPTPSRETKKVQLDLAGGILLILTVASFVLAIHWAREFGWSSPRVLFLSGLFLICLPGFLYTETIIPQPMLDLRLFKNRIFSLAQAGNFLIHASSIGILFLMPFYFVRVLHFSAQASGLTLLPLTTMTIIMGPTSGYLSDRFGTKWPSACGALFSCIGLYMLTSLNQDSSVLSILLRLTVLGLGRSLFQSPNLNATLSSISVERIGVAGGIHATMRHLGNLTGVAVLGSYFTARRIQIGSQSLVGTSEQIATTSFLGALNDTFFLSLSIATLALVLTLLQKNFPTNK